jgi:hypothetical protein
MPNEDTAPIPQQTSVARPGPRAVAFLFAAGVLLIVSTFLQLVSLPLPSPGDGSAGTSITAWGMDLGIGHTIPQYVGVVTLIAGVALVVVAAASLRRDFAWTRNASLVAGGLGVGSGLYLAAAGYSTGTFLAQLASTSGVPITVTVGPGIILAVLGAVAALAAIAFPPRREAAAGPVEDDQPVVYQLDEESDEE